MPAQPNNTLLIILDGWGHSPSTNFNAIHSAKTPTWDWLTTNLPLATLACSGKNVGLPPGQMGNSEVGHLHLGAGHHILQSLPLISQAFTNGYATERFQKLSHQHDLNQPLHLVGLLSDGGIHSHIEHIIACAQHWRQISSSPILIHAILDGRDCAPHSAQRYLAQLNQEIAQISSCKIASVIGRFYAMDRDNNQDRTQKASNLIHRAAGTRINPADLITAITKLQATLPSDEHIPPLAMFDYQVQPNDNILIANFRADRAIQLTQALTQTQAKIIQMTQHPAPTTNFILFPPPPLTETLGSTLANHGLTQLRIAETEKYAHVTYFFNGGATKPHPGEERILIASNKVTSHGEAPAMQAPAITEKLIQSITDNSHDFILCNFANADMVGHTGNFSQTVTAVEHLDKCLAKILPIVQQRNWNMLITADHGNAEAMYDPKTKTSITSHSTNPVPVVFYCPSHKIGHTQGELIDIAPTILNLFNIKAPCFMSGKSFLNNID